MARVKQAARKTSAAKAPRYFQLTQQARRHELQQQQIAAALPRRRSLVRQLGP